MLNKKTILLLSALCLLILSVHINKQSEEEVVESEIVTEAVSENANESNNMEIPENAVYSQTVTIRELFGFSERTVNIFDENDNIIISAVYTSENDSLPASKTVYTYDTDGRLVKEDFYGDNNYTVYEYDRNGIMISDTNYYHGNEAVKTEYIYDDKGRLFTEIVYENEHESGRYKYGYNSSDRLISKEYPSGSCEYYEYDDNGNMIEKTYGDVVDEYTYDEENRLIKHRHHEEYDWRAAYTHYYEYEYEEL